MPIFLEYKRIYFFPSMVHMSAIIINTIDFLFMRISYEMPTGNIYGDIQIYVQGIIMTANTQGRTLIRYIPRWLHSITSSNLQR